MDKQTKRKLDFLFASKEDWQSDMDDVKRGIEKMDEFVKEMRILRKEVVELSIREKEDTIYDDSFLKKDLDKLNSDLIHITNKFSNMEFSLDDRLSRLEEKISNINNQPILDDKLYKRIEYLEKRILK